MKILMLSLSVTLAVAASPVSSQDWKQEVIPPAAPFVAQPLPFPDNDYSDLTKSELVTRLGVAARTSRQLALIARGRAASPQVRAYADRVLADQTAADEQLANLAKRTRSTLPTELDSANHLAVERIMYLLGEDFDREFLKFNQDAYDDQITLLQAARNLPDPIVAEFAGSQLPTAIAHRDAANSSTQTAHTEE